MSGRKYKFWLDIMDGGIPEDRTRRGRQRQWDRQAETLMNVYMTLDLQIILETVLVTAISENGLAAPEGERQRDGREGMKL